MCPTPPSVPPTTLVRHAKLRLSLPYKSRRAQSFLLSLFYFVYVSVGLRSHSLMGGEIERERKHSRKDYSRRPSSGSSPRTTYSMASTRNKLESRHQASFKELPRIKRGLGDLLNKNEKERLKLLQKSENTHTRIFERCFGFHLASYPFQGGSRWNKI